MPPAGVVGAMDQDAVIQAQIDLELDNINLDDELDNINLDYELDDGEDVADDDENVQVTVTILNFWTERSGQTVQTQIRLLLEEQSDQGLHCLLFH